MSSLQADVSGGKASQKGSATQNVGGKAGPQAAIVGEMTAQFKQANFAGVRPATRALRPPVARKDDAEVYDAVRRRRDSQGEHRGEHHHARSARIARAAWLNRTASARQARTEWAKPAPSLRKPGSDRAGAAIRGVTVGCRPGPRPTRGQREAGDGGPGVARARSACALTSRHRAIDRAAMETRLPADERFGFRAPAEGLIHPPRRRIRRRQPLDAEALGTAKVHPRSGRLSRRNGF